MAPLADYLELTASQAREQFRQLLMRHPVPRGRQVDFLPVETLLFLAASFLVNHRRFGGATAHQAPEPVPSLARLFARPPSSVLAKMANLDGSRSHGARWDILAGAMLRDDPARFTSIYRVLMHAARAEGIGPGRLPDLLELEHGGELTLLGQDELDLSVLEASLREELRCQAAGSQQGEPGHWPGRAEGARASSRLGADAEAAGRPSHALACPAGHVRGGGQRGADR